MPDSQDISIWSIIIEGPTGSFYEGGKFKVYADFSDNYPFKPPNCKFITPIYHPNVKKDTGEICKDVYEAEWEPTKSIRDVIIVFKTLLAAPSTQLPLEAAIAEEMNNNLE